MMIAINATGIYEYVCSQYIAIWAGGNASNVLTKFIFNFFVCCQRCLHHKGTHAHTYYTKQHIFVCMRD